MRNIYSQGNSFGRIAYDEGVIVHFSVISHRAARLALKMSAVGKWRKPVFPYSPIDFDPLIFIGFQPETGRHLAVCKISRKGR